MWKGGLAKFKVCVLTCSFGIGQTWSLKVDADYFEIQEEFNKGDEKKVEELRNFSI